MLQTHLEVTACLIHIKDPENADKSSAVAEMGDHLATIDMGQKVGGCCALSVEESWVLI